MNPIAAVNAVSFHVNAEPGHALFTVARSSPNVWDGVARATRSPSYRAGSPCGRLAIVYAEIQPVILPPAPAFVITTSRLQNAFTSWVPAVPGSSLIFTL